MTTLRGRKLAGRAWVVKKMSGAIPPLTDFQLVQRSPAHPLMNNAQDVVGYFVPTGGIGPYRWSVNDGNPPTTYGADSAHALLLGYYFNLGTGTTARPVTCTDGRGTTVTKTLPILVQNDNSPALIVNSNLTCVVGQFAGAPYYDPAMQWFIRAYGGSHDAGSDTVTVSDPSGKWTVGGYGSARILTTVGTTLPPPGAYPVKITSTSTAGNVLTLSVTITVLAQYAPTIEFLPGTVSTAMPVGTIIGRAHASTLTNQPAWSLADPTGSLQIDVVKGDVSIARALTAGNVPVTLSVADGIAGSTVFTVPVSAGTALSPSLMTMSVNPSLLNAGRGQVIGTPSVAGYTGGTWSCLDLSGFNPNAELGGYACPRRIQQDPVSGQITAPGLLSVEGPNGDQPIQLQVDWVSGDKSSWCRRTFNVPVGKAPETVYHVGRGMSAANPGIGYETFSAMALAILAADHPDTKHVYVHADADPDYYAGDYGTIRSLVGPVIIEGVAANGVAQPRMGGPMTGPLANAEGGGSYYGKGSLVFGDGDGWLINVEGSGCHGPDLTSGLEFVRKDGQSYGNLWLKNNHLHDNDNCLESGVCHGNIYVDSTEFANAGTSHVSAGACHGIYVGSVSSLTVTNSVFRRATVGHLLKSRARTTTISNSDFLATTGGQASCCIELPNAGVVTITNCNVQKDVMGQNPYAIMYCAERDFTVPGALPAELFPWVQNQLTVDTCQIDVMTMGGAHFGQPAAVGYYRCADPYGQPMPPPLVKNTSMWLSQGSSRSWAMVGLGNQNQDTAPADQVIETTPSTRAMPFIPRTGRPFLAGTLPVMGPLRFTTEWGGDSYQNFENVQHVQDRNDIQIPHASPVGTVILKLTPTGNSFFAISGPAAKVNPFGPGSTWAIITDPSAIYYPYVTHDPWAPAGLFSIASNADGTGTLSVAGTLGRGVYYVLLRATAPGGTLADYRYAVVAT